MDGSVQCSCGHYNRHGYLCRHIFCVFRIHDIVKIPSPFINHRWTKNVLPPHLLDKRHRYGPCIEETNRIAADVHATIDECVSLIRNDTDKLSQFLIKVQEWKKQLEDEMPKPNVDKDALYADLLGVTVPETVAIKNPKKASTKGSKRIQHPAEQGKASKKPRTTRKVPFKRRRCSVCGQKGHNKRFHDKGKSVVQIEDDEDDEEDEDDDDEDAVQEEDGSDDEESTDEDTEE